MRGIPHCGFLRRISNKLQTSVWNNRCTVHVSESPKHQWTLLLFVITNFFSVISMILFCFSGQMKSPEWMTMCCIYRVKIFHPMLSQVWRASVEQLEFVMSNTKTRSHTRIELYFLSMYWYVKCIVRCRKLWDICCGAADLCEQQPNLARFKVAKR